MSAINTKTVTKDSQTKFKGDKHSLEYSKQLKQPKKHVVFYLKELNKKQLQENFLSQNDEQGLALRSGYRINVQGVQQRSQHKPEDQISVTKQKEFMTNRQSDNSQNLLTHDIEEKIESQKSNNSPLSDYFQKSSLSPKYSCQFQQPQNQENVVVSIKQHEESIMKEKKIISETQVFQITNRLEEQQQETPKRKIQLQKKNYPYKNLERSLFTYLQQFIKEKEKKMGLINKFKYFWRLKPQQAGKVKLIKLIYKQQQVLDFSIEFLTEKLWEQKAKVPKKIEQLKKCNEYYLKMLMSCSLIDEAQAYFKKNKIQFKN